MRWTYPRISLVQETQTTTIERNSTKATSVYDKPPVYVRNRPAVTLRSSRPPCVCEDQVQGPGGEHCQPIARDQRRLSVSRTMRMNAKPGKNSEPTRLVILGESGVGKSALVVRYLTKRFIWEYDSTLECTYTHQTTVDDETTTLEILDTTCGGDVSSAIAESHIRSADGFLIVYSATDRRSFEAVPAIKRLLDEQRRARHVSCVLVANKADLQHQRCVTMAEGERVATELACAFFETSASDGGDDISEAFHEVYREVKRRKLLEGKTRRRSSAQQVKQVLTKVFKIQNA